MSAVSLRSPMWLSVRNQTSEPAAEILIYDQIGKSVWDDSGIGAQAFAEALKMIPTSRDITVRINSPGGSVSDGLAIYNLLETRKSKVTTVVDGYALSAASIIALAGKELRMPRNALMMIHDPSTIASGSADDMRRAAKSLDIHKESLASIYVAKSGKSVAEIKAAMAAETWFTGDLAKEYGFADVVTDEIAITASFDLSRFRNGNVSALFSRSKPTTAQGWDSALKAIKDPLQRARFWKENHEDILAASRDRHSKQSPVIKPGASLVDEMRSLPPAAAQLFYKRNKGRIMDERHSLKLQTQTKIK